MLSVHGDGPARLFHNDGGHFTEIDAGAFPDTDRHDCAWGDPNVDGRPDIYCTHGADSGYGRGPNELWIQQPDRTFVNEASAWGVLDEFGRGRRTTFLDVNHDAYPDLFVGNEYPRKDGNLSPDRLFINVGGTAFRDASEYGLDLELGAICAQSADYDGDGWDDLLICGQFGHGLLLYRNVGGSRFADVTDAVGLAGYSPSAVLVDLNGDHRLDLALVKSTTVLVRIQRDGVFGLPIVVRTGLAAPRWIAAGDVNRDGRADLYVVQSCDQDLLTNHPDLTLLNNGAGTKFVDSQIPEADLGCGDVASPIDFDRSGTTDFVVMNGYGSTPTHMARGPVQLISFQG
jgi:hypothetical protein